MAFDAMMVFAGNAHPKLAAEVARHLGLPLGRAEVGNFSDGETHVELLENVRGQDVFVIQPTSAPTNQNIMELMIMCDALKRASATRITAVMPYFGYARQDRRPRSIRVPISAKVVADMLVGVGIHRILTVDLHSDQIQGFFDIPVDNIYATPVLLADIWKTGLHDAVVVSPDAGGIVRARAMATRMESDLAILDKRRPRPNESKVMHVIGDVDERDCILVDDIVDTAGTLSEAARALKERGARRVVAYITHGVLSGQAVQRISQGVLDEVVITDTIAATPEVLACEKIRCIPISGLLAEIMRRISNEESLSSLFD